MSVEEQLFEGRQIRLAALDPERDAQTAARWTHDADYMRLMSLDPIRPLSVERVKRNYQVLERGPDGQYHFSIRLRADDRLIGFIRLQHVGWTNGTAMLVMAIGDPADRGQGSGGEALRMVMRYAFDELNLYRLGGAMFEYNTGALRFFSRHGFVEEIRQRQAVHRDGRRWDVIWLGLLREEWSRAAGNREASDVRR
jgi:RimJ/RimL family protein N-acetyltransferase